MKSIFKSSGGGGSDTIAAERNKTYRGKDLTSIYSINDIMSMVRSGTFDDLYLGDIIGANTKHYIIRIIGINLLTNHGNTNKISKPNIIIGCYYSNSNSDNSTLCYYNSTMYNMITSSVISQFKNYIAPVDLLISDNFNNDALNTAGYKYGACDSNKWVTRDGYAANEMQFCGCLIGASSKYYDLVTFNKKLPYFDDCEYLVYEKYTNNYLTFSYYDINNPISVSNKSNRGSLYYYTVTNSGFSSYPNQKDVPGPGYFVRSSNQSNYRLPYAMYILA